MSFSTSRRHKNQNRKMVFDYMNETSKKIFLLDAFDTGHHKLYFQTLKNILGVEGTIDVKKFSCINLLNLKQYILSRRSFLEKWVKNCSEKSINILHLLYLDPFYTIGSFPISKSLNHKIKIIGTLHHIPRNYLKMRLLKFFSKKINCIIVHSEYLKERLEKNGILGVKVIDYPIFHIFNTLSKEQIRTKYGIHPETFVISILGGTRKDKGIDTLIKAFKFVNPRTKEKVLLNIAGPEDFYKKNFIQKMCQKYRIHARVELRYLSDQEFAENMEMSDLVVLPYRKTFTGNSGLMTEAVYRKIPVIGPGFGNLGYLIKKYHLGYTFKIENPRSLARTIEFIIHNGWVPSVYSEQYRKKLEITNFIEKHKKIYDSLLNGG